MKPSQVLPRGRNLILLGIGAPPVVLTLSALLIAACDADLACVQTATCAPSSIDISDANSDPLIDGHGDASDVGTRGGPDVVGDRADGGVRDVGVEGGDVGSTDAISEKGAQSDTNAIDASDSSPSVDAMSDAPRSDSFDQRDILDDSEIADANGASDRSDAGTEPDVSNDGSADVVDSGSLDSQLSDLQTSDGETEDARVDAGPTKFIVLQNPRSNADTTLPTLDNNHVWSSTDIGGQSFVAPSSRLMSGQLLMYLHGTQPSPEVQLAIFPTDANGQIDVAQAVYVGPPFKMPTEVNSFETAAFFSLGNAAPISLAAGKTYFLAATVRSNTTNPSSAPTLLGSGSQDRIPGHAAHVTTDNQVFNREEGLDLIFSLIFEE